MSQDIASVRTYDECFAGKPLLPVPVARPRVPVAQQGQMPDITSIHRRYKPKSTDHHLYKVEDVHIQATLRDMKASVQLSNISSTGPTMSKLTHKLVI